MPAFYDLVSYQTATGLLDNNFLSEPDQYYTLRRELIRTIQNQAYTSLSPFAEWVQDNRVFFTVSAPMTHTIGNINYPLLAATIYAMNSQEADMVRESATEQGITYTPSTFGAWVGIGSLDIFYW